MQWFSRGCAAMVLALAPVCTMAQDAEEATDDEATPAEVRPGRPAPRTRAPAAQRQAPGRRATRGPAVKIPDAANTIVQELRREFETGNLRKQSDYLKTSPNAEMTSEVILAMLQRRLGTSDSMDGYIKWQLVSGLPDKLSDEQAAEGLAAYANAPGLMIRPGISDEDRRTLDRELRRIDDPTQITAMFVNEVRQVDLLNEPVLNYRDALFAILPNSYDTFVRGLQDLYIRGDAGFTPRNHCRTLAQRIGAWQATAPRQEIVALYDVVSELLTVPMPEYYDSLESSRDAGGYRWTRRRPTVNDGNQLQLIADGLRSAMDRIDPAASTAAPTRRRAPAARQPADR